jgi:hypothetical protein
MIVEEAETASQRFDHVALQVRDKLKESIVGQD